MPVMLSSTNREAGKIKIWNNGKGIPVVEHKTEKMYVPTLIFGHLLTSSNYDDTEKKVTGWSLDLLLCLLGMLSIPRSLHATC